MINIETIIFRIKRVFIRSRCQIGKKLRVSKGFEMYIRNGRIIIGDFFSVRNYVSLTVDDNGLLLIGNNVFMNRNCSITSLEKVVIGDNCLLGENVHIYDHNHIYGKGRLLESGLSKKTITIGNNVWICSNVVVCAGVTIGDNCVIGANSTVYKDVPNNSVLFANGIVKRL